MLSNMTFWEITQYLSGGFLENCFLFVITLVAAIPLGLVITFGSMSKFQPFKGLKKFRYLKWLSNVSPIKWVAKTFVWIIRGTPLMLQLFVVFYVPGLLFDAPMKNRMLAACIAFVINYAAYFSEIYRGGIESIPKGQYEAGQVLGMTKAQVFFKIVLPQVIKRIVPPMSNEIITLVKDTSLARVISVMEILRHAETLASRGIIWPLFYTGAFFLLFNGALTLLFGYIEKKLDYYRG